MQEFDGLEFAAAATTGALGTASRIGGRAGQGEVELSGFAAAYGTASGTAGFRIGRYAVAQRWLIAIIDQLKNVAALEPAGKRVIHDDAGAGAGGPFTGAAVASQVGQAA